MARLKKGQKKKQHISFRLEVETIDRLRKIDKFHSKIDAIINKGLDEYEKWLNMYGLDTAIKKSGIPFYDLTECNGSVELLNSENKDFLEVFTDDEFRESYIKSLKELNEYYDSEVFFKLHPDIYEFQKSENNRVLELLENWDETKLLVNKKMNDIKKLEDSK